MTEPHPAPSHRPDDRSAPQNPSPALRLLVWDAPNIDATLGGLLERPLDRSMRPDFGRMAAWLCALDAESPVQRVEGCVFVNVPSPPDRVVPFVTMLRTNGFGVYAKPRVDKSDIDDELVDFVAARASDVVELVAATHDRELLDRLAAVVDAEPRPGGAPDGAVAISVLGFEEFAAHAITSPRFAFIDLENIPGLFATPLDRSPLGRLPPEGRLLPPMRRLVPVRSEATPGSGEHAGA